MKLISLGLLLALSSCTGSATAQTQNTYLPLSKGQVVNHKYYSLGYNEQHEQAEWVYYKLSPRMMSGTADREDDFREDHKIKTGSAELEDYRGSGYDRGHLAPAASMSVNAQAMSESFYLSNMSPQEPSFNRGIWKELEETVRAWSQREGELHVVTGPIFKDNKGTIGHNQVTVPGYYYKIIYDEDRKEMIGFVMPNRKLDQPLSAYVRTVDEIEQLTGINFFHSLADSAENAAEDSYNKSLWRLTNAPKANVKPSTSSKPAATSGQCQATTQAGKRCSRKATAGSKYCWQHQ